MSDREFEVFMSLALNNEGKCECACCNYSCQELWSIRVTPTKEEEEKYRRDTLLGFPSKTPLRGRLCISCYQYCPNQGFSNVKNLKICEHCEVCFYDSMSCG